MKTTKRLLVLLLGLALAFALAMPAFAEEDEPASPMPVITVQPEWISTGISTEITLAVEAEIPNGDPLGYQWYDAFKKKPIEGAVSPALCVKSDEITMFGLFYCVVYNSTDSSAENGPNRAVSEKAFVSPDDLGESFAAFLYEDLADESGLIFRMFAALLDDNGLLMRFIAIGKKLSSLNNSFLARIFITPLVLLGLAISPIIVVLTMVLGLL